MIKIASPGRKLILEQPAKSSPSSALSAGTSMDARLDLEVALADELWLAVEENVSALERRPSGEWHDMIVGRTGRSA